MSLFETLKLTDESELFLKNLTDDREKWSSYKGNLKPKEALDNLYKISQDKLDINIKNNKIYLKSNTSNSRSLELIAKELIPWKKGPYYLNDTFIDSEWRSDLKWKRFEEHLIDLKDKNILDIGSNNGYFSFLLSQFNPELVLAIDPVYPCFAQFEFLKYFYKNKNLFFKLWGVEHIPHMPNSFDLILYMGIIYHHRNPVSQLTDVYNSLKKDGQIIFETIGIPGETSTCLFPEDRYAMMRNVWFVPTLSCCINWLKKTKFKDIQVLGNTRLTAEEQRLTNWCRKDGKSLSDFLSPENNNKTVENHPAPRRFCISARKY